MAKSGSLPDWSVIVAPQASSLLSISTLCSLQDLGLPNDACRKAVNRPKQWIYAKHLFGPGDGMCRP